MFCGRNPLPFSVALHFLRVLSKKAPPETDSGLAGSLQGEFFQDCQAFF